MNGQKLKLLIAALALMGGGALLLAPLKANQKLGVPGIRTTPIPQSARLTIPLPERVLNYTSIWIEVDPSVFEGLPHDTSFGQRRYTAADGFWIDLNIVLMGADRTSLHKPQFCLQGAGWRIDNTESKTVTVGTAHKFELPVTKILVSREVDSNNQRTTVRGVYVYWFVADNAITADPTGFKRLWWTMRTLLAKGELQRWAYITCFAACLPGQEDATFERLKKFMAEAVPEFQLATVPAKGPGAPALQLGASDAPAR